MSESAGAVRGIATHFGSVQALRGAGFSWSWVPEAPRTRAAVGAMMLGVAM